MVRGIELDLVGSELDQAGVDVGANSLGCETSSFRWSSGRYYDMYFYSWINWTPLVSCTFQIGWLNMKVFNSVCLAKFTFFERNRETPTIRPMFCHVPLSLSITLRKHNTIGTFVIQWDVNKWTGILKFSRIFGYRGCERNFFFEGLRERQRGVSRVIFGWNAFINLDVWK
jgi:hypothetical protein